MTEIRHALPSDSDASTTVLVEAFTHDPLWGHLVPDPQDDTRARPEFLSEFMGTEFNSLLNHGHVHLVPERAVAMWTPPGVHSDDAPLGAIFERHLEPETWNNALGHFMEMGACRPEVPHFYLAVLGAADAARGQGLGSALLRRVLDTCDAEGTVAHLESSNSRNVSLYERHGFEVLCDIEFAPGVVVRPMTRQPLQG